MILAGSRILINPITNDIYFRLFYATPETTKYFNSKAETAVDTISRLEKVFI